MGSPDFAASVLRLLAKHYAIIGVVTQPDRPAGRGQVLTPPPVKTLALDLGLEVIQPERLRRPESFALLESWAPDLIIVAAYGQILRQNVLDLPGYGCINVHASLLPRLRGAAPIQAALLHGDQTSGATIMKMDAGVDTGGILSMREIPILPEDNAGTLMGRLAQSGAELLIDTLPSYLNGSLFPTPQEDSLATFAPMLKKEEGEIDLTQPAQALVNQVRAFNPWPVAEADIVGERVRIHAAEPVDAHGEPGQPVRATRSRLAIACGEGALAILKLQRAGGRVIDAADYVNGRAELKR